MTRGQITIITKDGILTSAEFNGDMYMPTKKWAGHGRKVINALRKVQDIADYHYAVARFNRMNHHYCVNQIVYEIEGHETLDFTKDYFDNWFSDYLYIKNITKDDVVLKTRLHDKEGDFIGGKDIVLKPNQIAVLYFGELKKIYE